MNSEEFKQRFRSLKLTLAGLVIVLLVVIYYGGVLIYSPESMLGNKEQITSVEANGQDETGFLDGEHKMLVVANCTACHSSKLVTQNRASREGWRNMIRWMQKTQNLWDLGENEEKILDYLSTHYAPEDQGRRANLKDIEWYELD